VPRVSGCLLTRAVVCVNYVSLIDGTAIRREQTKSKIDNRKSILFGIIVAADVFSKADLISVNFELWAWSHLELWGDARKDARAWLRPGAAADITRLLRLVPALIY